MPQRRTQTAMIAVSFLAVVGLAACSGGATPAASGSAADGGSIKLALIDPLTGTGAQYGQDLINGQKLAVSQINKAGGVLGAKLSPVTYDDQNLPDQGVTLAQRAIAQDHVKFIVGTNGSAVALAERNVTEKAKVVYMVGSSKGPTITDAAHHFVFRANTSVTQDQASFLPYVKKAVNPKHMAIIQEQSDSAQGLSAGLKQYFGSKVLDPVISQLTTTDFGPIVAKVQSEHPDAVFLADTGSVTAEAASIEQLKQSGVDVPIVIGPGGVSAALLKLVGKDLDGVVTEDIYIDSLPNAKNTAFVTAYKKAYGTPPTSVGAELGYEQVQELAQAITKAKTADDTTKVAAALRDTTFDTPRGKVTYDAQGQAVMKAGLIALTVKGGKIVTVASTK